MSHVTHLHVQHIGFAKSEMIPGSNPTLETATSHDWHQYEVGPPQPAVCSQMTAWKWSKTFSPRGYCVAPRNHLLHHLLMGIWIPHNRWPDWFKNKSRLHVLEHSKESSAGWWFESPKYRPMRLLMLWNHQPGCPYEVESATVDMFELLTASIASLMSWLWQ